MTKENWVVLILCILCFGLTFALYTEKVKDQTIERCISVGADKLCVTEKKKD